MKKIYILAAGLLLTGGAVNAQIQVIKNGGVELGGFYATPVNSPNVSAVSANGTTVDWFGIMKAETVAPITGTKSIAMISVQDSVAAATFQSQQKKTGGIAQQVYKGGALIGKTPTNFTFSFKYNYTPVGTDTAFVIINLVDSTLTGQASLVYQGLGIMTTQGTSILKTITSWLPGTATNANRAIINFGTSIANYFDDTPAPLGSKLVIDDVSFTITSAAGVEEITASSNVYPNPVVNTLNVEITNAEATSISIYSLDGSLVQTENLNGVKGSVNVENLKTGMYLYTIATKGGSMIQSKFLKK